MAVALQRLRKEIDERTRVEEALRESEERYRSLFQNNHAVMLLIDPETSRIMDANPAACAYYGFSKEELVEMKITNINMLAQEQTYLEMQSAKAEGGKRFEFRHRLAGGEVRDVEVYSGPIRVGGRELLYSIIHDITERKWAEAELEKSLSLLNATLESTADGILVVDRQGRITSYNQKFPQMWGITESVLGTGEDDQALAFVLEQLQDSEAFLAKVQELYGKPEAASYDTFEFKDGRFFERFSQPQRLGDTIAGRVWSFRDVTERKQAEEALRLNEKRLEALLKLNQMTDAPLDEITRFAMEEATRLTGSKIGYLAFMNEDETVLTMHAWSKSAMAECRIQDKPLIYPVETTGLWGEAVRQRRAIITNDYSAPNPWKKAYPEGHVQVINHMNVPIFDGNRIVIVAGVGNKSSDYDASDVQQLTLLMEGMWRIVQRKRAEEALRDSEERYKALFERSLDWVFLADFEGRFLDANQAALDVLGYQREDISSLTFASLLPADQLPLAYQTVAEVIKTGHQKSPNEYRVRRKDGGQVIVETQSSLIYRDGKPFAIQGIARDITERKRAEEEIRKYQVHLEDLVAERTAALSESEARYRAIIENAPIGISLRDQHGRVLAINPALESILGYSLEEYDQLGRAFLHPDDADYSQSQFRDLAEGRRENFEMENRSFHKDGRLVWGRVRVSKIKGQDKDIWFVLSLIEDITQQKVVQLEIDSYQERLRALAAELTLTEERERRILATNLHDNIGQALALLQIKLGSLKEELASSKAAADLDEARNLLSQIIKTTRSLTLELGLSVLHELGFESGLEWLGEKYQEQYGLQVEVDCERLNVSLDDLKRTMLFRAVQELLTNIIKHAQARYAKITLRSEREKLKLRVRDDGIGFDVSNLTAVAGFGLFSIAERVSNLGGQLNIESAPGKGAEVIITLSLQ
jgi:PAS domain S-box-containing protein